MKSLIYGVALTLGIFSTTAAADQVIEVDGEPYLLSTLTANCQSIQEPTAQIACFGALSKLIEAQSGAQETDAEAISHATGLLQASAQFGDEQSGLTITASGCNVRFDYYGNYFHISRRNISSIDVFSAEFDASQILVEQIAPAQGGTVPMLRASMAPGSAAILRGGQALESAHNSFAPRAPGVALGDYAAEVVGQLQGWESATFDFVLIHPEHADATDQIWASFNELVSACRG